MKKDKKILVSGLVAICMLCASCSRIEPYDLASNVAFYIDNQRITTDTITVPLNSYQEFRIESTASQYMLPIQYQWQYATGAPNNLCQNNSDNFHITSQSFDQTVSGDNSNEYIETALFTMHFSDEVYHSGDICKLRVKFASGYYEKVLNIRVE